MKKHITIFVLLFYSSLISQEIISANQGYVENKSYFENVPYELVNGKIFIDVSIENDVYKFLLDTGASTALSEQLFKTVKTSNLGSVKISDQSGITDSVQVVAIPKISISGINFINIPAFISKEKPNDFFKCLNFDGIIGSNLLRNSTIQFDSKNKLIIVTDNNKNLKLKKGKAVKIELNPLQSNPFIPVKYKNGKFVGSDYALFDSGDNGLFLISGTGYKELEQQVDVFEVLAESKGSTSIGYLGSADDNIYTLLAINELELNGNSFNNIKAETTYGGSSRIGSEILNYGIVTIDYKEKLFWMDSFQSGKNIDVNNPVWSISPTLTNTNDFVVGIIWDEALKQKINVGDKILQFDTIDYRNMDYCDIINSSFKVDKQTAKLVLKDKDTGEVKEIMIKRI